MDTPTLKFHGLWPCLQAEAHTSSPKSWEQASRLDRIHLQVSQRQYWRTSTDNENAIFDSGKRLTSLQKNRQGEDGFSRQLKGESQTAAEVVMDDALVQDDGIDLIVEGLDRCLEVTQDQDKASKIEKAFFETQRGVKMETTFMSHVARRKLSFQTIGKRTWERHYQQ